MPEDFKTFAVTAFKNGLSQDQFKDVMNGILSPQWEAMDVIASEHKEEMKELNAEWGMAYDTNMSKVKNFLMLTDAPDGIVELATSDAMSAAELKWIHAVATATKSEIELTKGQGTQPDMISPVEAQEKIQEMLNNSEHAFWNSSSPLHKEATNKMVKLQELAHPKQKMG
jgi:hypothetical protein